MINEPAVVIYRHDDADGLWAAAIVYNHYKNLGYAGINIADVPVNYNKNTWDEDIINKADYVYVLDFTFEDMDKLVEVAGDKLIWIDHHKTAMEKFPELWDSSIKGVRSLACAGVDATWMYFYHGDIKEPNVVEYIRDRDLWLFRNENTKAFCEAAYVKIKTINNPDITIFLNSDYTKNNELEKEYIEFGNARLDEQAQRVKKAFDRGSDITFNGYSARIVNTVSDISEIGEYVYTKDEYDIAIMWYVDNATIRISLRSNSKDPNAPDCAKLAQKYGGGGHFASSGFNTSISSFYDILLRSVERW